jgi:transcription antitermination factor NusG
MDWCVVTMVTGSETKVLSALARAGVDVFDAYCPMIAAPPKASYGKLMEPVQPLFPGYVFVRADCRVALGSWRVLRMGDGETPSTVPQDIVAELRAREGRDGIIRPDPPRRRKYRAGQMVRATSRSLLSGLTGIVASMSGEDRVRVLFELLGRKTAVTLRETELV